VGTIIFCREPDASVSPIAFLDNVRFSVSLPHVHEECHCCEPIATPASPPNARVAVTHGPWRYRVVPPRTDLPWGLTRAPTSFVLEVRASRTASEIFWRIGESPRFVPAARSGTRSLPRLCTSMTKRRSAPRSNDPLGKRREQPQM